MKCAFIFIAALTITPLVVACDDSESGLTPTAGATVTIEPESSARSTPTPFPSGPTPLPSYLLPTQTVLPGPARYYHSAFGYSYEVPVGWFVHGNYSGYSAITSFEPGSLPPSDLLPPGHYKIEVYVSDAGGESLWTWLAERDEILGVSPDEVDQRDEILVSGVPAITRRVTDEHAFLSGEYYVSREYWFATETHVFTVWGGAGEAEFEAKLAEVIESFRLDP